MVALGFPHMHLNLMLLSCTILVQAAETERETEPKKARNLGKGCLGMEMDASHHHQGPLNF